MNNLERFNKAVQKLNETDILFKNLEDVFGREVADQTTAKDWRERYDDVKLIASEMVLNGDINAYDLIKLVNETPELPF